jgi:DNA polymerase III epsilon subunit-like protein
MRDIESDFVILDTETTGLDAWVEIVEFFIIGPHGNILFDSLIKPIGRIPMKRN